MCIFNIFEKFNLSNQGQEPVTVISIIEINKK